MSDNDIQKNFLLKLLTANSSASLKSLVESDSLFKSLRWKPYGGFPNNTGSVEGQMKEPENALIEKVTNAIDAILMRKCYEEGIDPKDPIKSPKDMEEAIMRYFGGREKIREQRSNFAKEMLRITATGNKDKPTITIIDKGEGQDPENIAKTILSLHQEIKKKIRFVYGTYNQGGSSALGFSGDYSFVTYLQLVLCRRATSISEQNGSSNLFGFTIVRKRYDEEAGLYTYEYFVDENDDILSFPFEKPIDVENFQFIEGCVIRLYNYQLSAPGNIVFRGLNEALDKKLSYSPLPIFLKELRDYRGDTEYTIFGLKEKLGRLPNNAMYPGFPTDSPVDLGEVGKKPIRVFILQHKSRNKESIESYLDQKEKVFFVRNGMTLHTETATWLREYCGLTDIAPYIVLFVDISELNPAIAQILHSGREGFRNNDTTKLTLERLKIFLESYKELDREYGNMTASDTSIDNTDLKKHLAKEAAKDPELRKLFNLGDDFPVEKERGPDKTPYVGDFLPSKFDLLGDANREVEKKTFARVSFKTDAEDDLFHRLEDVGQCDWTAADQFYVAFVGIHRGVITFRIDVKGSARIGSSEEITFYLRIPSKKIEFSQKINFTIVDSPDYVGEYFPKYFNFDKEKLKIPVGEQRKLVLSTDVQDDYFTRIKDKGQLILPDVNNIEFNGFKLADGLLEIKVKHLGNKIEEIEDLKLNINDDNGHKFEIIVPAEIVPPDYDPNLKLPELKMIKEADWKNETPVFEVQNIARIPNWTSFDVLKLNIDSILFQDLNLIPPVNREKARKLLIDQVYFASVWLYIELRSLSSSGDDADIKHDVFDRSIRGMRKLLISNLKKLIR